jgi:hypothetical protein
VKSKYYRLPKQAEKRNVALMGEKPHEFENNKIL